MQRGRDKLLKSYAVSCRRYANRPEQMITRRVREYSGSQGALDERLLIVVEVIDDMINELGWKL